jgi:hypothetical protein
VHWKFAEDRDFAKFVLLTGDENGRLASVVHRNKLE